MLTPFLQSDIAQFLALAKGEGWICGAWELEFLLREFPQGCLVKREGEDVLGYITSLRHDQSGWIGNLLVPAHARRRGIGSELMQGALQALLGSGAETVWLTASAKGEELYRKLGFVTIDSINRWVGEGGGGPALCGEIPIDREVMHQVDRAGWGDRREALLEVTSGRGRVFCSNYSFLCTQQWEQGTQIGPWGAIHDRQAEALFDLSLLTAGERVFVDVPAGNAVAAALLPRKGFTIQGNNTLMYLGKAPEYDPDKVYALASMGSMG